jgi:hypothetical protein
MRYVICCAGFGYLVGFTLLFNFMAFLALEYYSGQQTRASVSLQGISSPGHVVCMLPHSFVAVRTLCVVCACAMLLMQAQV